jgi:Endo-alpha-N-acetylgalactosaminidase
MENRSRGIGRRRFLKAGGAGLAAFASAPFWAQSAEGRAGTLRSRPVNPVVLKSSEMEMFLDRQDGLPYEYRLTTLGTRMGGEELGEPMSATICRLQPRSFSTVSVKASSVKGSATQATFQFEAQSEGKTAATFAIRYALDGGTVHVTMLDIEEAEGYELIEVAAPRLATVREEDGGAWLAHGDGGGSVAELAKAAVGHLRPNTFWGTVAASLPVVMVGSDKAICVQEVTAYMDGTELAVAGEPGHRLASLGTIKRHRVNGSLCYNMNTGSGTPRNCGNATTPNLLIEEMSACRLDFIGDLDGDGRVDWLDGGKLVRRRMPEIPTHFYDDRFTYAIHCDEPTWKKPGATFEQAEQLIHDVATLTDNMPQIAHLWGWQFRGKDTGYPAVNEVDERIGGYDGLMHLMEDARKYNCVATLSDNYDDAYKSSPAWDPAIIARRPDGELWESRNWTGENSYIIGMAKFMAGPGIDRVDYTCKQYRLRETIHVDVLTYFSIRNDWDREHPASGIKNLKEGRYKVLERFSSHGVDVSSEALRYAFIGKVSSFWYAQGPVQDPFGGDAIPLLAMIYRKSALWGQSGKTEGPLDALLKMLFYNGAVHLWHTAEVDRRMITDLVFINSLPWQKVRALNIEKFGRQGERTILYLEHDSVIDLDWKTQKYSVTLNGAEIARDGSTFCPLDDGRIAFYSLEPKELSAPLPMGWKPGDVAAIALDLHQPEELHADVNGGRVKVAVPARRPVMIYRDGAKARKRLLERS